MRRAIAATLTTALTGFVMAAGAQPAAAFWPRSQWLACSEAQTAADYRRQRCWELDIHGRAITPGGGDSGEPAAGGVRRSIRRGDTVRRLG